MGTIYREELITGNALASHRDGIDRFTDDEIRRAIGHHRRALEALRGASPFDDVRYATAERLLQRLDDDLAELEDELRRRGAHGRPAERSPRPRVS